MSIKEEIEYIWWVINQLPKDYFGNTTLEVSYMINELLYWSDYYSYNN